MAVGVNHAGHGFTFRTNTRPLFATNFSGVNHSVVLPDVKRPLGMSNRCGYQVISIEGKDVLFALVCRLETIQVLQEVGA